MNVNCVSVEQCPQLGAVHCYRGRKQSSVITDQQFYLFRMYTNDKNEKKKNEINDR